MARGRATRRSAACPPPRSRGYWPPPCPRSPQSHLVYCAWRVVVLRGAVRRARLHARGATGRRPARAHRSPTCKCIAIESTVHGAWSCYAAQCGVPASTLEGLLAAALPALTAVPPEPPILSHAAARLLLSVSKNVKFSSDPVALVGDLFSQAQRSLQYLEPKV
ncbi:unnamed protein product [Plutella xylostella]|uniref:(diamondback moth) hypothetical protein n=1 Tax=Plutella xylostella TaxID=51655 RepID=A0A8S4DIM0_PLUXY|nr:unnamed protein product [Plutella xylostella]